MLAAGLLLLISVAVLVTLLSARSLEGAVPGRAPLLGLAVTEYGYYVASETGLFFSSDAKSWSKPEMFSGRPVLVTGLEQQPEGRPQAAKPAGAMVLSGGRLLRVEGGARFSEFLSLSARVSAMASSAGSLYLAEGSKVIRVISEDCLIASSPDLECRRTGLSDALRLRGGPDEILTLDAVPADPPLIFAGGLRAGVWRSSTPQVRWRRVLQTATRAIMVDDRDPKKIYLGTAGGLLVSQDQGLSWGFTGMRQAVEALAQAGGTLFALAGDRLIYQSSDGQVWNAAMSHPSHSGGRVAREKGRQACGGLPLSASHDALLAHQKRKTVPPAALSVPLCMVGKCLPRPIRLRSSGWTPCLLRWKSIWTGDSLSFR